jgi:hypothetical protein
MESASDDAILQHPVNGSCDRCGCPLSHVSCRHEGVWYCCGPCASSDRCRCGCRSELAHETSSDRYVPTRRMFAARPPDELRRPPDYRNPQRAFPFADRQRGR